MKNLFSCLFLVFAFSYGLQAQLNDYKYIIVPRSFQGFKYPNQYKTSTLIKHLFTKSGFQTFYKDDHDPELYSNRCLGLLVRLDHKSGMFITRVTISLEDCNSKKIFTSLQGSSKEKDYTLSYKEAIEMAFTSIAALDYSYNPAISNSITVSATMPGADEKSTLPPNKEIQAPIPTQELTGQTGKAAIAATMTAEPAAVEVAAMSTITETSEILVLYAQQIPNGYQLVDSSPKIRLKIYKTSNPEVYIGINEQGNGIVYKLGSQWYFEHYESEKLQIEELTIKF